MAIKKRSIIEDSIIEKVIGLDDVQIEKLNKLVKKIQLKKKDKQPEAQQQQQFLKINIMYYIYHNLFYM